MTAHAELARYRKHLPTAPTPFTMRIDRPRPGDGPLLWRLARDSGTLDLNSAYSYLLWCRDFAGDVRRGP